MRWTRERQRWVNLVLMNLAGVVTWYFQRTRLGNDRLWIFTLPIILAFLNGIAFATIISRRAAERRRDSSSNT